ncbi:olfactory receptor 5V1-like [Spea bombifrons]|uniref:olfactory receptor 5V1-like n=1 Tax=Spea bombifrons TaxID=233779 RepID=UPI00234A7C4F|nr:olfactory receptor 5V1-like [Spea bombifrons]
MNGNQTILTDFLLLGLFETPDLKVLAFFCLFVMYLLTLVGNITITLVTNLDKSLHTPMYFFLGNLSFLDICYTSTTMPKMLQVLLAERKSISFISCAIQLYLFFAFVGTECILLGIMSYDRFLAICNPLRYSIIMSHKACIYLAAFAWLSGFVNSAVHSFFTFCLHFCGSNKINYFYCDIPPLLSLSCDNTFLNEILLWSIGVVIAWMPFFCIIISYTYIIITIIKIKSSDGRQKAFSTCASHLTVVILYYGSSIFSYVRPVSTYSLDKIKVFSVVYSIVTPMLNPLIYTLKNQDVKNAVGRQFIHKQHL